jgi:DNA-binding helix-hairpin-helix protein with protein kinase domain
MQLRRTSKGELITFSTSAVLGAGGEARIFGAVEPANMAVKIYHRPTLERTEKLRAMIANPPDDPMSNAGHVSIAWPTDLLTPINDPNKVVGFMMPLVRKMNPVIDFYHPKTRRQKYPLFSYRYLLRTARNLAGCVSALHARGYVVGDLNESNILVGDTAMVTLVDTDSFQVPDPRSNRFYRCRVGKPEFTPPELQNVGFALVDRKEEHDLFALAVLIFQLLMEGTHPFAGRHVGFGEPPSLEERIASGQFPHLPSTGSRCLPMPTAPRFSFLSPSVQALFLKCFEEGRARPSVRPTAGHWQTALEEAEQSLLTCAANDQHRYGNHLPDCPWCRRKRLLGGLDPFPSRESLMQARSLRKGRGLRPGRMKGRAYPRITFSQTPHWQDRETWPAWVWAGALGLNLLFFIYVYLSAD